jgi:MoxR-like ATPase
LTLKSIFAFLDFMNHQYITIEDFKLEKKDYKGEWIPEQQLVLTPTTKKNLKKILPAIQKNQNVLLVGDAGTGKNAIIYFINYLRNQPTYRFSFNEDLLPEDLIGSYRLDPISKTFVWQDGLLTQALKKGITFVADEINLANVDVLKRFQSVFMRRELELLEGDGTLISANDGFQFIATQNPVEGFEGRKPLPREIQKYFVTIWIDPYPKEEVVQILKSLFPIIPDRVIQLVVDIQQELEEWIVEKKVGARDYERYHFNIRNLKRIFQRLVNDENPENLYWEVFDIFVRPFRNEEDQSKILELIQRHFKNKGLQSFEKNPKTKNILVSINKNQKEIKIGRNYISLKHIEDENLEKFIKEIYHDFPLIKERLDVLEAILRALENKENVLLECDSNVEPESYVDFISRLYNRPVQWIHLSKGMHTSDVLGGLKPINNSVEWIDGPLTKAVKNNHIIVISGLEAAGPELVEKLNMLLDDARALTLPAESGQNEPIFLKEDAIIIGIKYFRKSKNQNTISRAFRNRFTSILLPEILSKESIVELVESYFYHQKIQHTSNLISQIHLLLVHYAKERLIGLDRMEGYQFGLVNLYRFLDYITFTEKELGKDEDLKNFLLEGIDFSYLNEISNLQERSTIREEIRQLIENPDSLEFLQEFKELKKKRNKLKEIDFKLKNDQIYWDPNEHWREANTGKASWDRDFKEIHQGINIDTPETGGDIKEGPDAWYGADTQGNKGVGEPGHGGGAWGYRTEELYQQFLQKRQGLSNYDLGIPITVFKKTLGKELEKLIFQLEHLFDPEYIIHRNYEDRGSRVDVRKYLSFWSGKGNQKIFDKTIFDKEYKSLKELEILFLINKGRRIFHFEYSVAILVAMMSSAEILSNHKISFGVVGYSDLENFKKAIDLQWFKKLDQEYNELIENQLYYGIINNWSGDTVQDAKVIQEVAKYFSYDARTKIIVVFSDFRGSRGRIKIEKEWESYDYQMLKEVYKRLIEQGYIFLGISLGPRNLGHPIFEHHINITSENYFHLPRIMNEKLSELIHKYHE